MEGKRERRGEMNEGAEGTKGEDEMVKRGEKSESTPSVYDRGGRRGEEGNR